MKLKEQEQAQLKGILEALNTLQGQVGSLEYQKHLVIQALDNANEELGKLRKHLEDTYGNVNINIETGEITDNEK